MLEMRGFALTWACLVALGASACATVGGRMERARMMSCRAALEEHATLLRESAYKTDPKRPEYDLFIAGCMLQENKPQQALGLASTIQRHGLEADVFRLTARAAASLGNIEQTQAALDALARYGADADYFLHSVEFRKYTNEDWFIAAALSAWAPQWRMGLEEYVGRLVGRGAGGLVPLRVVFADAAREPGEWAVWVGNVKESRLDRDKNETVLMAEGVDVTRELVAVDRKVTRVTSEWTTYRSPFKRGPLFSADVRAGEGTATPEYETNEVYEESFTPNGLKFEIDYPLLSDEIVQASTVMAIGRYAGRNAAGVPRLRALVVASRAAQQSRERVAD